MLEEDYLYLFVHRDVRATPEYLIIANIRPQKCSYSDQG